MHHCVEPREIRLRKITDVFTNLRHIRGRVPELAARKQVCVQADHFMARGTQEGARNGADIAFMASQQYSHVILLSKTDLSLGEPQEKLSYGRWENHTLRHLHQKNPQKL